MFDAPWLPVHLAVIGLIHPLLGVAAGLGAAVLTLLAVATEHMTRAATETTLGHSRSVGRHAEVIVGIGMASAIGAWRQRHEQLLAGQSQLDAVTSRLSALARVARQGVQMAVLGIGAWLVVGSDASPGIMVAATILLGRALQPVEHLISGWKQLVDARVAWRRLSEPHPMAGLEARLRLPAPTGRLELERVVFTHDTARPALIKGVSFAIDAGESQGIVGGSGSGKTTLARLLLGVWQPHSGAVRLDDANLAHWDRGELGVPLGCMPQDASLLAGTVAQNIARLGEVDDAKVIPRRAAGTCARHDSAPAQRLRHAWCPSA